MLRRLALYLLRNSATFPLGFTLWARAYLSQQRILPVIRRRRPF